MSPPSVSDTRLKLLALLFVCSLGPACDGPEGTGTQPDLPPERGQTLTAEDLDQLRPRIKQFCGGCHAYPEPETFPAAVWGQEVQNGFGFFMESGRTDLSPPPLEQVVKYYTSQAPAELSLPEPRAVDSDQSSQWILQPLPASQGESFRRISSLEPLPDPSHPGVVACDLGSGGVWTIRFRDQPQWQLIARLKHPARATPCDLNQDGVQDFLVAELGTVNPADHDQGQVVWLQGNPAGDFTARVLLKNLGRVADVRAGDFNGDSRTDLLVAEFGWRKTGGIHLLLQASTGDEPTFERRLVDRRHGTIHLPTVDWNQDGHLDFVALISQEHEQIVAYLNRSDGTFESQLLFAAPDPAFGSSGIDLVDFDQDGDLDVLYSSGDTMDSFHLKPTHGVRWLERTGDGELRPHLVGLLPGCYRALPADLDQDGDLDVVATAQFPENLENLSGERETLVWFEQREAAFHPHSLAVGTRAGGYFTISLGDYDGDEQIDILTGDYAVREGTGFTLWRQK